MVSPQLVLAARQMMSLGFSMQSAAIALGVRSSDLDWTLWAFISIPDEALVSSSGPRLYQADFE